ncbi:MAG: hypothetical protein ACE5JV_02905 [Nitrososphaerales archaeon]
MSKKIASDEKDLLPLEKWLASFRKNDRSFIRQFMAEGYYEAYDTVLTYAEKRKAEIVWFKEKRNAGHHMNRNYPELESICVYCNAVFNDREPIPCKNESCETIFCSRDCMQEHYTLRHGAAQIGT